MARMLPARLADKAGQGRRFEVEVVSEPFTAECEDPSTLMERITDRAGAEGWDIVVALTDLPLHTQGRKLVVNVDHERGLALLSLPALGGFRLRTKARRAVEETVIALAEPRATGVAERQRRRPSKAAFAGRLTSIHPGPVDENEGTDLRYVVSGPRGYVR
ncbi:hypothetical protein ABTZ11_36240, partial [Streptomyces sp. NPDC095817]